MATNDPSEGQDLVQALSANDWSVTLEAVAAAERAIRDTIVGDAQADPIVEKLVMLASHPKWGGPPSRCECRGAPASSGI